MLTVAVIGGTSLASDPASAPYPLTTCVVSGDKLGAMGKPVILNEQGTEVRFCCRECVESFKQDPAKHLAKLKTSTSNP